jgi:rhodanese-related sulfurtransferase
MDAKAVAARLDDVQLVDVRYPNEWEAGHIEGAVHIPGDYLAERLGELDRGRKVVTVCRAGTRSMDAAEWLRTQGFDAENLDGGMLAWKWAGLPFVGKIVEPVPPPDDRPPEMQALQAEMLEVIFAAQERFGDREPSEDEVHDFLKERMVAEGKTPEEAEAYLAEMGEDQP